MREAVRRCQATRSCNATGRHSDRRFLIRVPLVHGGDQTAVSRRRATGHARAAGRRAAELSDGDRQLVSAAIGADLQRQGIYAVAASIPAITAYIAIRFRSPSPSEAIAATIHDIRVTLACWHSPVTT